MKKKFLKMFYLITIFCTLGLKIVKLKKIIVVNLAKLSHLKLTYFQLNLVFIPSLDIKYTKYT